MPFSELLETIIQEHARTSEFPTELVRQAWSELGSREAIVEMMLESLQKIGGFEKIPFWMAALSASIPCEGITELYQELRSRSVRNELEWRLAFQAAFSRCKEQLPAIEERAIRTYDLEDGLLAATREDDIEAAALMIDCMLRVGLDPCEVRIASLEDLGLSDDELQEMSGDDLAALVRKVNRERGTPVREYAVELGHERITRLFDSLQK